MQFRTAQCLACQNTDTHYPRLTYNHNEIPYCSNCASTTSFIPDPTYSVPSAAQKERESNSNSDFNDLAAMFSKNLMLSQQQMQYEHQQYLLQQQQQQQQQQPHNTLPTPPLSPNINYSITQHYHHSAFAPSPPQAPAKPPQADDDDMMEDDPVSSQLFGEMAFYTQQQQQQQREQEMQQQQLKLQQQQAEAEAQERQRREREYAAYLYSSDLSSPSSNDALAIEEAVEQQAMQHQALEESCSASAMLQAAARERERKREEERKENERKLGGGDPVFRNSEWFNDYYGGLDSMYESYADADEDAPCCVVGNGGGRLRPFGY